jgi:predicted phosphodiesterase
MELRKASLILCGKYDVVVCGHTHRVQNKKVGKTLILNPGTANGWFFGYGATVAIFDTQMRYLIRKPENQTLYIYDIYLT